MKPDPVLAAVLAFERLRASLTGPARRVVDAVRQIGDIRLGEGYEARHPLDQLDDESPLVHQGPDGTRGNGMTLEELLGEIDDVLEAQP